MTTAKDLIKRALRLLGIYASGESPTPEELTDGLTALNDMLQSWSLERLMVYCLVENGFPLTAGIGTYTIGPGGNFNTERPVRIDRAFIRDGNAFDHPLELIGPLEYANIPAKGIQAAWPDKLYYNPIYPLGSIRLHPLPNTAVTLQLQSWSPLPTLSDSSAELTLPPGYAEALVYNLAIHLAPEYGREATPTTLTLAQEGKRNLKRLNLRPLIAASPTISERRGGFNIFTG